MGNLREAIQQFIYDFLFGFFCLEESNAWREHKAIMGARKDLDDFVEQHKERIEKLLHERRL